MNEETPDLSPMSSPVNDVRKLQANSTAAAGELIQWLEQMRGKSPREVLGKVANSGLVKSFILAAFLIGIVIALWTAGDWSYQTFVAGKFGNSSSSETEPENSGENPGGTATAAANGKAEEKIPDNVANPNKAEMPDLSIDEKKKISDKLGIGESKEAPANLNPLDSSADDLLKGLE